MILTFRYRIKDATSRKHLDRHATACNQVWNFCVEKQKEAESRWRAGMRREVCRWPTPIDLTTLCRGSSVLLGIHSDTIHMVCYQFVASRNANRRCPGFRASHGARRALGWIPFSSRSTRLDGDRVVYLKRHFRFWKSREIGGAFKVGAFAQDARGRWYVNFQCAVDEKLPTGTGQIGVDLGLKALATCSDGATIPALHHFRQREAALSMARRAHKMRRVRAIHAKIANARRHHLHEWSTKIARENELIVTGDIKPTQLDKTSMAKSIYDASWTMLRNQLRYKASRHGARYVEVSERWSTQTCSDCHAVGGPKGIAGLGIRRWECHGCGSSHDRDVNAARNILRVGLKRQTPAEGIVT